MRKRTKIYRHNGKKWKLPIAVRFEGMDYAGRPYRIIGFRPPNKGEYYLSGAKPSAYKAPNDLSTAFLIVEPT